MGYMKRINKHWYECEDNHITVGDEDARKKCEAHEWQLHYVKGKRKGDWKGEKLKTDKKCGKAIVNMGDIPLELNYFELWDLPVMHAFLISQKFDAQFMVGLQEAFVGLEKRIDANIRRANSEETK